MSKVITTQELISVAVQFFENYPTHEEVYVTEDGQPFFEENRAILHADDKEISYKRFVRGFESVEEQLLVVGKDAPKGENSPEYRGANPDEEKANYEEKVKELQELELVVGKDTPKGEGSPEYRGANPDEEKANYEEKVKELQELELVSNNYNQLRGLVHFFGLEVSDQKAPTLIAALEEFKQKISE